MTYRLYRHSHHRAILARAAPGFSPHGGILTRFLVKRNSCAPYSFIHRVIRCVAIMKMLLSCHKICTCIWSQALIMCSEHLTLRLLIDASWVFFCYWVIVWLTVVACGSSFCSNFCWTVTVLDYTIDRSVASSFIFLSFALFVCFIHCCRCCSLDVSESRILRSVRPGRTLFPFICVRSLIVVFKCFSEKCGRPVAPLTCGSFKCKWLIVCKQYSEAKASVPGASYKQGVSE